MKTKQYIVKVQDFGEVHEYKFQDLEQARYLMRIEQLPCTLWEYNLLSGHSRILDSQHTSKQQAI